LVNLSESLDIDLTQYDYIVYFGKLSDLQKVSPDAPVEGDDKPSYYFIKDNKTGIAYYTKASAALGMGTFNALAKQLAKVNKKNWK